MPVKEAGWRFFDDKGSEASVALRSIKSIDPI